MKLSKRDAAIQVAAEFPPSPGWPHTGRVVPAASWVSRIRDAKWPTVTVDALLEQWHGPSPRVAEVVQPVACVPREWLARMAELMDVPWGDACRYDVPDAIA